MPLHEMRWMSKDAAVRAMIEKPRDCEAPARDLIGSFGGRMHHHHLMPGEYDRLAVASSRTTRPRPRPACGRARRAPSRASGPTRS